MPAPPLILAGRLIAVAASQVGEREEPPHSNLGAAVERYQAVTKARGAPWCVSFRQWLDLEIFGSTYANGTANVYAYEAWAIAHADTRSAPLLGDAVCYHVGAGHMGTVISVIDQDFFLAIEGNEGDAVARVTRDRRTVRCTFVRRPELHRHS